MPQFNTPFTSQKWFPENSFINGFLFTIPLMKMHYTLKFNTPPLGLTFFHSIKGNRFAHLSRHNLYIRDIVTNDRILSLAVRYWTLELGIAWSARNLEAGQRLSDRWPGELRSDTFHRTRWTQPARDESKINWKRCGIFISKNTLWGVSISLCDSLALICNGTDGFAQLLFTLMMMD